MKKIIHKANEDKDAVIASFFFYGHGLSDQKSLLGLLRTLLHQIIHEISSLLAKLTSIFIRKSEAYGEYNKDWKWHESDLRDFFKDSVLKLAEPNKIRVYVDAFDAFDEYDKQSRDDVLDFLQLIAGHIKICVSRRYLPHNSSGTRP